MGADRLSLGNLAVVPQLLMNPGEAGVAVEKTEVRLEWQAAAGGGGLQLTLLIYCKVGKT